jgi:hypothetical protein
MRPWLVLMTASLAALFTLVWTPGPHGSARSDNGLDMARRGSVTAHFSHLQWTGVPHGPIVGLTDSAGNVWHPWDGLVAAPATPRQLNR